MGQRSEVGLDERTLRLDDDPVRSSRYVQPIGVLADDCRADPVEAGSSWCPLAISTSSRLARPRAWDVSKDLVSRAFGPANTRRRDPL